MYLAVFWEVFIRSKYLRFLFTPLWSRANTALTGYPFRHTALTVARSFFFRPPPPPQIKAVRVPSSVLRGGGGKVKANYVWKNGLSPPPLPLWFPVVRPLRLHSTQLICCHCGLPSLPLSLSWERRWRRRRKGGGGECPMWERPPEGRKDELLLPGHQRDSLSLPSLFGSHCPKIDTHGGDWMECGIHVPFRSCRQIPASKVPFSLSSPSFCSSAYPCSGSLHLYSCCSLMFDESTPKLDMWRMGWSTFAARRRRRRMRQRQFFLLSFSLPLPPIKSVFPSFLPRLLSPAPND